MTEWARSRDDAGPLIAPASKSGDSVAVEWSIVSKFAGTFQLSVALGLAACLLTAATPAALVPYTGVAAVSNGQSHTCATRTDATVWCWGKNDDGQFGRGDAVGSATPQRLYGLPGPASAVAAGRTHSCAIVLAAAYCWGNNDSGQLGNGSDVPSRVPVPVSGLGSGVTAIAVGDYSSCAIVNGGARCWGSNFYGSLGDGSGQDSALAVPVSGLQSGVTAISAGVLHACAIVNGAARCWGNNYSGQVGDGEPSTVAYAPVGVSGMGSGVSRIVAAALHSCAIMDNAAYCWGANDSGQLGTGGQTPSNTPAAVQGLVGAMQDIAIGALHSCALGVGGAVRCWGDSSYGQIGNGGYVTQLLPVDVGGLTSDVLSLSARGYGSCARRTDLTLRCWGLNAYGQLGDGSEEYRTAPVDAIDLASGATAVAAGLSHSCAVVNGVAECWGYNGEGDLGNGVMSLYTSVHAPVVNLAPAASAVAAGDDHSCAIVSGGVWCWGLNDVGQLGNGSNDSSAVPVPVQGMADGVSRIAMGGRQSCAVRNAGLWCWGYNGNGELGNGSTDNSAVPVAVSGLSAGVSAVSVGPNHSCAIANGAALCWGVAFFGQLGDGSIDGIRTTPVFVSGMGAGATDISAGYSHSCGIALGVANCWGYNGYGQLGDGSVDDHAFPAAVSGIDGVPSRIVAGDDISCAVVSGSSRCWGGDYYGDLGNGGLARTRRLTATPVIGMSNNSQSLAINGTHVCALTTTGGIRCWGDDFTGQLGIGRRLLIDKPVEVVLDDTIFANPFD